LLFYQTKRRFVTFPQKIIADDHNSEDKEPFPCLKFSITQAVSRIARSLPPPLFKDVLMWPKVKGLLDIDQSAEEMKPLSWSVSLTSIGKFLSGGKSLKSLGGRAKGRTC
jgi:hypothetical protein